MARGIFDLNAFVVAGLDVVFELKLRAVDDVIEAWIVSTFVIHFRLRICVALCMNSF